MTPKFLAGLLVGIAVVLTLIFLRVIVPGLVNLHNDGALILVFVLVVGAIVGWYYFLTFINRLLKGDFN